MKKRLLTTIAASALIAAQITAPVMAADGTVTVNVTDKEAVIRVVVPTALEIAVDQFETVDKGAQIYSEAFAMENKSAVPVKVSVTSTATATADLVSKVSEVNPATASANGKAWLAVAAQISDGKYADGDKGVGDLTETNNNVKVFDATNKKAEQVFYLEKGSGNAAYKFFDKDAADASGDATPTYAKYYELTAATLADNAALQTAVDAGDVYYEATTGAGKNGNALTKIAKGTKGVTKDANSTYYNVGTTAIATPATGKKYVYAEMGTAGEKTAFRYIGKLEDAKTWSKSDISKVVIEYDIAGVTATSYEKAAENCIYGLYSATSTAPSITTTEYTVNTANNTEIAVNLGAGAKGAKGVKSVTWSGEELINSDNDAKYENGKVIIDASVGNYFNEQNLLPATLKITFDMNKPDAEAVSVDVTLKK